MRALIEQRVARKQLVPVTVEGVEHWAAPATLETVPEAGPPLVHILSPFDPLVIQRDRLSLFFGYTHVFEAYVPKAKRVYGYFALPVLAGDEVVAVPAQRLNQPPRRATPCSDWCASARCTSSGRRSSLSIFRDT
ncbi:DNA glycosylase AlkZ-like family protein [Actinoplanes sp. CA-030573]|uniref:DNA glycosylase AlkZ-like family protein n=1 Tax=Actinoplanes sp. CA-030573 TaxID=3239898 RepID=UPI003D9463E9